ncbi:pectinesterase-like [Impatiens glandulifera]|uniref:pectinesterase-like n=1 Tax=Impatiens glandulifera TaxID=253017 RepID=UPI001FB0601F|nr:pectinesterase-like [Impatiens glandulifera]
MLFYKHMRNRAPLLLITLFFSISVFLFLFLNPNNNSSNINLPPPHTHSHLQIAHHHHSACDQTLYTDLCVSTLASIPNLHTKSIPEIISATINVTVSEVRSSEYNCSSIRRKFSRKLTPYDRRALEDCLELLDDTIDELRSAISDLSTRKTASKHYGDLQTLLSGAMTNQQTCLDGFAFSKANLRKYVQGRLRKISKHVSNSLAMLKKITPKKFNVSSPANGGEPFPEYGKLDHGFPTWVTKKDRRLLQIASANETKADLVVAKDGSGNFTTVGAAVAAAPNSSTIRFVIYIKAGAYFENVEVDKKKTMIMFVGDGIGKTLIKGNRSVVDGWTTFRSATVAVVGNGFVAKGITFENYAGPSKHQAVALRSGSDFSAFYQCSFVAYQDTLYVHSLRQFYRDCDIYGTVDFIFGNAAVVFQNSNLYARRPNDNQKNIFTAQGREDPNQNTGISILNCKIAAGSDLIPVQSTFKSYLGRPWKLYSHTAVLLSNIGDLIEPAGWLEWSGDFALNTLVYREYKNRGVGSNTTSRVKWDGFKVITNVSEANQYTVGNFIEGGVWLPAYNISFYPNLTASGA